MTRSRRAIVRKRPSRDGRVPERFAELMNEAERARRHAYAPYSRFRVGAALLTASGHVIRGANIENASFGLSVCAERNAVWKAVSDGERDFVALAISAGAGVDASPCGSCRQVFQEFAPNLRLFWRDARGRVVTRRLPDLLKMPFQLARE